MVQGQTTDIFKRHPYPQLKAMSFSLLYKDDSEEGLRTLDITCKTEQEFELWFWGIQVSLPPAAQAGGQDEVTSSPLIEQVPDLLMLLWGSMVSALALRQLSRFGGPPVG